MKTTTTIIAIFAMVSAIGAVGIVTSMSNVNVAHASTFGSCNQVINGEEHSIDKATGTDQYKGKAGADVRKEICSQFK